MNNHRLPVTYNNKDLLNSFQHFAHKNRLLLPNTTKCLILYSTPLCISIQNVNGLEGPKG